MRTRVLPGRKIRARRAWEPIRGPSASLERTFRIQSSVAGCVSGGKKPQTSKKNAGPRYSGGLCSDRLQWIDKRRVEEVSAALNCPGMRKNWFVIVRADPSRAKSARECCFGGGDKSPASLEAEARISIFPGKDCRVDFFVAGRLSGDEGFRTAAKPKEIAGFLLHRRNLL